MAKNRKITDKGELNRQELIRSWCRTLIIAVAIIIFVIAISFICLGNFTRHGERFVLPSFTGMTLEQARIASEGMDVQFDVLDSIYIAAMDPGVILDQYPKAGNFIKSGRRITITKNTNAPKSVKIPYITGYSLRQAKNRLVSSGLQIGRITYIRDIATNYVLKQLYNGQIITPNSDFEVPVNSGIDLYVGTDESVADLKVPNVLGEQLYIAKNRLWEDGINIEVHADNNVKKAYYERAFIYRQYPFVGESLPYGEKVELYITLDSSKVKKSLLQESSRMNEVVAVRDILSKLKDSLAMFDNPDIVILNDNMLIRRDSLMTTGKMDTIIISSKYEIEEKLEKMKIKLDSLKRL